MRYLVTGAAGFIGSHLVDRLIEGGHEVVGIDDLSGGSLENLAAHGGDRRLRLVEGDVRDAALLDPLVRDCDRVVHLAASVGVELAVNAPLHVLENNIHGAECVLESATRHGKRVLMASSSDVYGKGSAAPLSEQDDVRLGPASRSRWSYAAGKLVADMMALARADALGLDVVIFRPFNVVGPRQSARYGMVVPRFVRQALRGEPINVYGDGTQRRSFCHVRDAVQAILALADCRGASGAIVNLGADGETSIAELARHVARLAGGARIRIVPYEEAYPVGFEDVARRVPDLARLEALIGRAPRCDLDRILADVIEHERACMRRIPAPAGE